MTGLCATVFVGFAALAIDVASWQVAQRSMQGAADTAAYSAGLAYGKSDGTSIVTQAKAVAAAQGYVDGHSGATVTVNQPPKLGGYTSNATAIEVIVQQPQARFLSGLFVSTNPTVSARAVSTNVPGTGNGCVLALDSNASSAIAASGAGSLNANLCDVVANSSSATAITIKGASTITTPCIVTVGGNPGTSVGGAGTLDLTKCTNPTTDAGTTVDPYASVPTPAQGPTQTNTCASTGTLSPGYFASGISISSTTNCTFSPGVYYVNGNFSINGSATVSGTGVTIYIAKPGSVSINGAATVNFTAPTSGTYSGIAFFGDRAGTVATNNKFNGAAGSTITGAIYFPTQTATYNGSSSTGSSGCTQLIADMIVINGSSTFNNNCTGTGVANIIVHDGSPGTIQVVE